MIRFNGYPGHGFGDEMQLLGYAFLFWGRFVICSVKIIFTSHVCGYHGNVRQSQGSVLMNSKVFPFVLLL